MEVPTNQAELLVARIIAGTIRFKLENEIFHIKKPSRFNRYIAQEIYQVSLEDAIEFGLWTEQEMLSWMYENDLWSEDEENLLKQLPEDLEEFKIKMYNTAFDVRELEVVRKACKSAKEKQLILNNKKNIYSFTTAEGYASIERSKYIMLSCLYLSNGTPLLKDEESEALYWDTPFNLAEKSMSIYNDIKLDEQTIRYLARNEPWRSIWSTKKSEGAVFGVPTADLSDEQRAITIWSIIYDNISEHPEAPPEDVINDDDVLDGWMIIQKRSRQIATTKTRAESLISNDKIKNSQEIFIPAGDMSGIKKINELNDMSAQMTKLTRFGALNKKGQLSEDKMPDSQMEITRQRNEMFNSRG